MRDSIDLVPLTRLLFRYHIPPCRILLPLFSPGLLQVPLLQGLVEQRARFVGAPATLYHLHTEGEAPYLAHPASFRSTAFFCAGNDRAAVNDGSADFVPIFLSEVSSLWKTGAVPLDYALLQVSPPDRHGYCSLGTSVDVSCSAMQHARHVIAIVNPRVPRTHGDGLVHVSRMETLVELDSPLPTHAAPTRSPEEDAVGAQVARLVPDGATLQVGIGRIPDAVLNALRDHKELGVFSEMFSDGVMELVKCGAVTGSRQDRHPYQVIGSFCVGSQDLLDFLDDNPLVKLLRSTYVNNPANIAQIENMHAINTCVEVDLTGQVCSDSIGTRIHSGVGGQNDFMRGASIAPGGKAIMALTSRTAKGVSRIVPYLKPGAGVTLTRNHVHWVCTEYGCVNLFGKNLKERAALLTSIAHPDDREGLERAFAERFR